MHTVLIANRGEIAARIIRTCRNMGLRSVAIYSDADREAPYVQMADIAFYIGESPPSASYLQAHRILDAARRGGADAIHPGYGFLSENAAFARLCAAEGFIFIGPHPDAIEQMGSKSKAKQLMAAHGVPTIPGYQGEDQSEKRLLQEARLLGFPVLLKASAGGGGKGMRIVYHEDQMPQSIEAARREAMSSFGNDELIVEKYFPDARHIEFQIFGDRHGNVVHLLERECSLQRRHQKVMEESPSPVLTPELRRRMGQAAVDAAKALHYDNAGTVEFIFVGQDEFYFLEVNTRLQVEHPVTEAVTGLDLVQLQIEVAAGKKLPISQEDVVAHGYALECRLYAEDARNNFLPVAGRVLRWIPPILEGLRYESAVTDRADISIYYDPMIAKIIAFAPDRAAAFQRLSYALGKLVCLGLTTNLPFLRRLIDHADVRNGEYTTRFIETSLDLNDLYDYPAEVLHHAALALTVYNWQQQRQSQPLLKPIPSGWRNNFFQDQKAEFRVVTSDICVYYRYSQSGVLSCRIDQQHYDVRLIKASDNDLRMEINGMQLYFDIAQQHDWYFLHYPGLGQLIAQALPRFPEGAVETEQGGYSSPMPGEILKVLVEPGQKVKPGENLLILVSMKMENTIVADADGEVEEVYVNAGQHVAAGAILLKIKTTATQVN